MSIAELRASSNVTGLGSSEIMIVEKWPNPHAIYCL